MPLISVLMTSYNREKYIGGAIESVLNSTFRDFELLVVDDGSKDGTVSIARDFAAKDARVRVIINEQNLGDYPNRNNAAKLAVGKYLKYVDADDLIYPYGLEILVNAMEAFPNAGWGLCSLPQNIYRPFPFVLEPKDAYEYHYFGPGLFHKAPLSSIIRKDFFESVGGFSGRRMVGDFEMWHKLAMLSPVVLIQEGIVWYREHGEQEMAQHRQFEKDYKDVVLKALNNNNCPLDGAQIQAIKSRFRKKVYQNTMRQFLKLDLKSVRNNISILKMFR